MILLDTHAAIWLVTDDQSLGKESRSLLAATPPKDQLAISAISFWEIALLVAKRRVKSLDQPSAVRDQVLGAGIIELPLTGDIAMLAVQLDNLHGDPADRFIAATAIVHNATLMTADKALLRWRHKLKRQDASK